MLDPSVLKWLSQDNVLWSFQGSFTFGFAIFPSILLGFEGLWEYVMTLGFLLYRIGESPWMVYFLHFILPN